MLQSTNAKLFVCDNVLIGPNVLFHTGNHEVHCLEKNIINATLDKINPNNFRDIIIESDTWIGDETKILKGVKIVHIGLNILLLWSEFL